MKPERHQQILDMLQDDGEVAVAELSRALDVSEMTIRRDLQELERAGLVRRVHGGATRSLGRAYEPPFRAREARGLEMKRAIGRAAADLVDHGDAIALDVGSTVLALVPELAGTAHNLTVVTASLRVALEVAATFALEQDLRLILTGGVVRAEELSMTGQMAVSAFASIRVDKAFVGVGGLNPLEGATEFNLEDAEVKRRMIASARQVIVLADSTKLGRTCFAEVCPSERIHVLVTDTGADPAIVEDLRAKGLEVILAQG